MVESMLEEVQGARFGDQRLSNRLNKVFEQFSAKPHLSIPAATDGRAEMEGAYRFFNNPKVTPAAILASHRETTLERVRQSSVALLVQDTTKLDVTRPHQQVEGAGSLGHGSRCGMFYHPLMAFTEQGLALGTVWDKSWTREPTDQTCAERIRQRRQAPLEEKESVRWLEGLRAAHAVAQSCPATQCVCIADSEADVYELFSEPRALGRQRELHVLVRACHDRALQNSAAHLLETVAATPALYTATVNVSRRDPTITIDVHKRHTQRDARIAEVEVRARTVTLRPPRRTLPAVSVNVVLVQEPHPPAGQEPIQWILITTLPIGTSEQIKLIVQYYCIRWQIEVYFRTLKSGCRIESRFFERLGPLQNCLAVYSIVAWKVLYLCRLSRECPDLSCEVIFTASEWKSVYMTVRRQVPSSPPTLNEMIRMIASLGGYVIRKSTNPGTQTLWIGLQRVHDLSTGWQVFGPNSTP
jgi:hypothetical protein